MAEQALDLWPDIERARIATPVTILKQQAALLGKHTGNLLEARVTTMSTSSGFLHRFVIEAPALGGYQYELFDVRHDANLYPVQAQVSPRVVENPSDSNIVLISEQELVDWLGRVLKSTETKRILGSLLAQIES
jgi:hypothetical protein